MHNKLKKIILYLFICCCTTVQAHEHPCLLMTPKGVESIRRDIGKNALFDASIAELRRSADGALSSPMVVPVPKDGGGGVTHEVHKGNYYKMFDCGVMYQITGEKKYAEYVTRMLLAYADLYPTLDYHPVKMSSTVGRLFWQTLNDHVWLVHTSVAYDCVYDYLTPKQREQIEGRLFRPMVEFITGRNDANYKVFNLMHNHGTWATAAVGMICYVMDDRDGVDRALYGSDGSGKTGGFILQLDRLFSPDGYFTEGPYYQRYSIWPFVIFAQAIQNNQPDRKIFGYRDGILKKAVNVLLQESYDGQLFLFNDAMPKGYDTQELIFAIDILYNADPSQKSLLSIARDYQKKVLPTDAGYAVARDVERGEARPFVYPSLLLRDGRDGTEGGVAILRGDHSALVFKATSHGLSHGHYDKLMISYYDNGSPILTDYGSARFHNIEVKYNGNYTPLNKDWAMSTIAHNTLSVDGESHYGGRIEVSSKYHPEICCFDVSNPAVQVVSARESNAYPGVTMERTLVMTDSPAILDIFKVTGAGSHCYDLPFYYNGTMVSVNAPYEKAMQTLSTYGPANGYQHLWKEAWGKADGSKLAFTFLNGHRFYTVSTLADEATEFTFVRSGANDKEYFLRSEPGYIVRRNGAANHTFVTVIEPHGDYNTAYETVSGARSAVGEIKMLLDNDDYTVVEYELGGVEHVFAYAYRSTARQKHAIQVGGRKIEFKGCWAKL